MALNSTAGITFDCSASTVGDGIVGDTEARSLNYIAQLWFLIWVEHPPSLEATLSTLSILFPGFHGGAFRDACDDKVGVPPSLRQRARVRSSSGWRFSPQRSSTHAASPAYIPCSNVRGIYQLLSWLGYGSTRSLYSPADLLPAGVATTLAAGLDSPSFPVRVCMLSINSWPSAAIAFMLR
ncbi:hypothetical protein OE88DRAFT_1643459 [Heliocybe sulcata]|uniref:Uncharacterized protein n=1 Tax=Heliocybe sulcata TaxID=5364 RepID=A0A5C3NAB2_9AGAM|nr:hypothetical protein OE88DRAFT_1643459 [Heliocybe sulcata]